MRVIEKGICTLITVILYMVILGSVSVMAETSQDSMWEYNIRDMGIAITAYNGSEENLEIPSVIDNYTVVELSDIGYDTPIKNLKIPDTVNCIGGTAFFGNRYLERFNIPHNAFIEAVYMDEYGGEDIARITVGCENLKYIDVDDNNEFYSDIDGVMFNKNQDTLLIYPRGKEENSYTVPSTVMRIGESAFYGSKNFSNIVLNNITTISGRAFDGCTALEYVNVPEGVEKISVGAFSGCNSLKAIKLPSGLKSLGHSAFYGCNNLTSVLLPSGLIKLYINTFGNCIGLKHIVIPSNVKWIGEGTFSGCSSLEAILIESSDTVFEENQFWNGYTFEDIPNITIFADENSKAKEFADKYNLNVKNISETKNYIYGKINVDVNADLEFGSEVGIINLSIKNNHNNAVIPRIYVAAYNDLNQIINIESTYFISENNKETNVCLIMDNLNQKPSYIRIFSWEKSDGILPLCESQKIQL